MIEIIIFFLAFYFCMLSVISYGNMFEKLCFGKLKSEDDTLIYTGFYGLMFLTLISLVTSYFMPHNFYHNVILHGFGFFYFFFSSLKKNRTYLKYIFFISLLTISALVISKTNDDLSYYHFPFTKYLTEYKIIFGMGHLNHGYNLLSSLFFLNSTFYLPFIKLYSFHFSLLFFLIFFNYFLLKEIFSKKNDLIIKYLYFFAFLYFNVSFNRISEFGTDKGGQLLIVLLIIKLFDLVCFNLKNNRLQGILLLLPLLGYCISLKTYFLPYVLLSISVLFINNQILKNIKFFIYSKSFLFFLTMLALIFSHHFVSTGCIISPLPFTCFGDSVFWSREIEDIKSLSTWLENWAKSGAGPGYRTENISLYIQNFNWVGNWIERYFIGKFTDQIAILFASYFLIILFFKNFFYNKETVANKKRIFYFYLILLTIFLIWFTNHPTLRYGGYSILFLIISLPMALIFQSLIDKKLFYKKIKFFIIFVAIIFNLKNFDRIKKEFDRTDLFQFNNFPFFAIKDNQYTETKFKSGLTIYSPMGHCWSIPSPCGSIAEKNLIVNKKGGYHFIQRIK